MAVETNGVVTGAVVGIGVTALIVLATVGVWAVDTSPLPGG